jgi:mevalonate kinase
VTDTEKDIKYLLAHRNRILKKLPKIHKQGDFEKVERYMKAIQELTQTVERMKRELEDE